MCGLYQNKAQLCDLKKNYNVCCIFLIPDFYIDPKIFPEVIVGVIVLVQKYKKPISIFNTSFSRIVVI